MTKLLLLLSLLIPQAAYAASGNGCLMIAANQSQRLFFSLGSNPQFQSGCLVVQQDTGIIYEWNGSAYVASGGPGVGILSLNGLTGATQTFSAASSGISGFSISSSGSSHTFSIPISVPTATNLFVGAVSAITSGTENIVIGSGAGAALTSGNFNTYVGKNAGHAATTMDRNTGIGNGALLVLTTGASNTAVGFRAGSSITGANADDLIGEQAGSLLTSGSNNQALGYQSLGGLTTGGSNVGIGFQSGITVTTGGNNTFLGFQANANSAAASNRTAIGNGASSNADNAMVLGNSSVNVGIGSATSPAARLEIPAGTATAGSAPLKFNSGTVLTTPVNGVMEYDGSNLLFTSGGSRQIVKGVDYSARAYSSTTTISGTLATIVYATEEYDPSSSYNNATGVYTAAVAGKYQVNASLLFAGTISLNNTVIMEIQKNGSVVSRRTIYLPAALTDGSIAISDVINCAATDTIQIQVSTNSAAPSIVSSNFDNYLSITKVF